MTDHDAAVQYRSLAPVACGAVRFIIATVGRTGSTRLRLLLDSHPMVRCHGELFGGNLSTLASPSSEEYSSLLAERDVAPAAFMAQRAFASGGASAVGFKILHSQLTVRWPGLLEALQADRDVRIIHLVRRNGLKRFLSEYFVGTVTQQHMLLDGEAPPAFEPVELPVASLLRDLDQRTAQCVEIREAFAGHPFHELAYEDSLDDNGPEMQALLAFIGVPVAPLSARLRKVLPDDPRQLVTNYDEIERVLAATPYRHCLE